MCLKVQSFSFPFRVQNSIYTCICCQRMSKSTITREQLTFQLKKKLNFAIAANFDITFEYSWFTRKFHTALSPIQLRREIPVAALRIRCTVVTWPRFEINGSWCEIYASCKRVTASVRSITLNRWKMIKERCIHERK